MLVRMGPEEFALLEKEWAEQCAHFEDEFSNYSTPSVDFARTISNENPPHQNGGVYKLDYGHGASAIVHINCARLPKTEGKTLRVLWLLLAPRFDYEDVEPKVLATITANLILGAVKLAQSDGAKQVKIHLGNSIDRAYFSAIAVALATQDIFSDPAIRGQWLEFGL